MTTVCIQTKIKNITVTSIYCPPRFSTGKEEYVHLFQKLRNCFLIGGDYNAENTFCGPRLFTPKGIEHYEEMKE